MMKDSGSTREPDLGPRHRIRPARWAAAEPIRTVLVATDFSGPAGLAIDRVRWLPLAEDAQLVLLHAVPSARPPDERAAVSRLTPRLRRLALRLERHVRSLGASRAVCELEVRVGEPFAEIVRRARASSAELIVIGRRGEGAANRRPGRPFAALVERHLGSTAEKVLRRAELPVLVVSAEAAGPYRRPVAAVDLSDISPRILHLAFRMAHPVMESLVLAHAYHVPYETWVDNADFARSFKRTAVEKTRRLLDMVGDLGAPIVPVIRKGTPESVIYDAVRRYRADLVVTGTAGRSGVSHLILGSVAEWVAAEVPCDVLVGQPRRFSYELP